MSSDKCKTCREKEDLTDWLSMPEVDWDGTTPLVIHRGYRFFFNSDDLAEFLLDGGNYDIEDQESAMFAALEDVRLCLCKEVQRPCFDLIEFMEDYDDEAEIDKEGAEAEKAVNDWISGHRQMWTEAEQRPTRESLMRHLKV